MIRQMTTDDISAVLDIMRELRHESPTFSHYPEDEPYATANLTVMVQSPTSIMLIDDDQRGVMFGYTGTPWWSPYYEANEMLLAVHSEHRGSSVAARLIKEFERVAVSRECRAINVGSSLGIADDLARRLYMKLGFVPRGQGLTKRIDHV